MERREGSETTVAEAGTTTEAVSNAKAPSRWVSYENTVQSLMTS
jgi:hypothetical protein